MLALATLKAHSTQGAGEADRGTSETPSIAAVVGHRRLAATRWRGRRWTGLIGWQLLARADIRSYLEASRASPMSGRPGHFRFGQPSTRQLQHIPLDHGLRAPLRYARCGAFLLEHSYCKHKCARSAEQPIGANVIVLGLPIRCGQGLSEFD